MQIGADIYCDSQCINREFERRLPECSFMPASETGLMWCLGRWADDTLFDIAVKLVLGSVGNDPPKEFSEDCGRLCFGEDWAELLSTGQCSACSICDPRACNLMWMS